MKTIALIVLMLDPARATHVIMKHASNVDAGVEASNVDAGTVASHQMRNVSSPANSACDEDFWNRYFYWGQYP